MSKFIPIFYEDNGNDYFNLEKVYTIRLVYLRDEEPDMEPIYMVKVFFDKDEKNSDGLIIYQGYMESCEDYIMENIVGK